MKTLNNRSAFDFEWGVDPAGYEWHEGKNSFEADNIAVDDSYAGLLSKLRKYPGVKVEAKPENRPRRAYGNLTDMFKDVQGIHLVARGTSVRVYRPLQENEGLFRDFSQIHSEKSVLQFADKYGLLFDVFGEGDSETSSNTDKLLASIELSFGTSLKRWRREAGDLAVLVKLWDAISERKLDVLRSIIIWTENDEVRYEVKTPKNHNRRSLNRDSPDAGFQPFKRGDLLAPARYALQYELNERLADMPTAPRLVWTPDNDQQMVFRPPNLLAAMWLQFAQAITGPYQLRKCAGCGRYFQVGPGASRRADALTCRDSCRQLKRKKGIPS